MRINQRMRAILGRTSLDTFSEKITLSEELSGLLRQGFTDLDGAVVFTAMRDSAERIKPDNFPDLTGYECFVNHIHVEDHVEDSLSGQSVLLRQGVAFALATENQLRSAFTGKLFKVIVAFNELGCGVRFHSVRLGEEWLAKNLDEYAEEAILVLET